MNLRDWFIVVGIILIVVILLDGVRRVRQKRAEFHSDYQNPQVTTSAEHEDYSSELPNGGARVIKSTEDSVERHSSSEQHSSDHPPINPSESNTEQWKGAAEPAETSDTQPMATEESTDVLFQPTQPQPAKASNVASRFVPGKKKDIQPGHALTGVVLDTPTAPPANAEDDVAVKTDFYGAPVKAVTKPRSTSFERKSEVKSANVSEDMPREVIVINVVAKEGKEYNLELLSLINACGLTHGEMGIYHRNEDDNGLGKVQFSMANGVEPGTFNLSEGETFITPGVCFFMSLPGASDLMKAFDYMLETANCVIKNFGGELRDENHSVITTQTIEHYRQQVRNFNLKAGKAKIHS